MTKNVVQASLRQMKISLGLVEEFAATERNGNSFRVYVNKTLKEREMLRKRTKITSRVDVRPAADHTSVFLISVFANAHAFSCLPGRWCGSILVAHLYS